MGAINWHFPRLTNDVVGSTPATHVGRKRIPVVVLTTADAVMGLLERLCRSDRRSTWAGFELARIKKLSACVFAKDYCELAASLHQQKRLDRGSCSQTLNTWTYTFSHQEIMVFLTFVNMTRNLIRPDKFWRKEMYKRMSWHFYGRRRNCFGLSIRYVRRALRHATESRRVKKDEMTNIEFLLTMPQHYCLQILRHKELWTLRIEAACQEHGLTQNTFRHGLVESDIALNRKTLADLAIYEPRTFSGLVELVKQRNSTMSVSPEGRLQSGGESTRGVF